MAAPCLPYLNTDNPERYLAIKRINNITKAAKHLTLSIYKAPKSSLSFLLKAAKVFYPPLLHGKILTLIKNVFFFKTRKYLATNL